ncbi:hypothetical protein BSG8_17850 [Bacillus subtilis subsp. natto]|nr:hypothetical protein BSG8_17850 [Bacillus subtilis subsp. natto]
MGLRQLATLMCAVPQQKDSEGGWRTPLALYLLFYQIKNCVSKEPYAFLTYTVNITLPGVL